MEESGAQRERTWDGMELSGEASRRSCCLTGCPVTAQLGRTLKQKTVQGKALGEVQRPSLLGEPQVGRYGRRSEEGLEGEEGGAWSGARALMVLNGSLVVPSPLQTGRR